jgi:hypothetical protein
MICKEQIYMQSLRMKLFLFCMLIIQMNIFTMDREEEGDDAKNIYTFLDTVTVKKYTFVSQRRFDDRFRNGFFIYTRASKENLLHNPYFCAQALVCAPMASTEHGKSTGQPKDLLSASERSVAENTMKNFYAFFGDLDAEMYLTRPFVRYTHGSRKKKYKRNVIEKSTVQVTHLKRVLLSSDDILFVASKLPIEARNRIEIIVGNQDSQGSSQEGAEEEIYEMVLSRVERTALSCSIPKKSVEGCL